MKQKSIRKSILILLAAVVLIALTITANRSFITFDKVLHQSFRGIERTSERLLADSPDLTQGKSYEDAMLDYALSASAFVNTINAVSKNSLFYKKYRLENFGYFIYEELYSPPQSQKDRDRCMKILNDVWQTMKKIESLDTDYAFGADPKDFASAVSEIEIICKEWAN